MSEPVDVIRNALEVIAADSMEQPVDAVLARSDGGEITVAIQDIAYGVAALVAEHDTALHALRERDERDAWLARQLDNTVEDASTVARTVGLALARAVVRDLRNARAALGGAGVATGDSEVNGCPWCGYDIPPLRSVTESGAYLGSTCQRCGWHPRFEPVVTPEAAINLSEERMRLPGVETGDTQK